MTEPHDDGPTLEEAKDAAELLQPEVDPEAADLPADVRDDIAGEDEPEDDPSVTEKPPTTEE